MTTNAKKKPRVYEVLVSFDGLNKGERFTQEPDAWADQHVSSGYLAEEVPDDERSDERQG